MKTSILFALIAFAAIVPIAGQIANAQIPPPLESNKSSTTSTSTPPAAATTAASLGKITIQISQTEQIVIDLPLKNDNKYQVVPIK